MFNRSEIMKAAWARFRHTGRWEKTTEGRRKAFGLALWSAWACAKAAVERARLALLPVREREIARITSEIEALEYLPFAMSIAPRRAALEAQLSRLAA